MKKFELLKAGPKFLVSSDENSKDFYKDYSKYNQNKSAQQLEVQRLLNPDTYTAPNITPMRNLQNRVNLPSLFTWKNANVAAKPVKKQDIEKSLQEAAEKNETAKKLEMKSPSQKVLPRKQEKFITEPAFLKQIEEEEEATPTNFYPKQKPIFDKSPSNARTLEKLPQIKKANHQDYLKPVMSQSVTNKRSQKKTPIKGGGKARKGDDYDEFDDLKHFLKANPSSQTGLDAELEELLNFKGRKLPIEWKI